MTSPIFFVDAKAPLQRAPSATATPTVSAV
jgi:hypothetical protein